MGQTLDHLDGYAWSIQISWMCNLVIYVYCSNLREHSTAKKLEILSNSMHGMYVHESLASASWFPCSTSTRRAPSGTSRII
jgi:hypothetical protein